MTPPARPSTRSGGCSALPYPGGPAIMAAAAEATRHDVVFPRAWLGTRSTSVSVGFKTAARRTIATETDGHGTAIGESALTADRVAELADGFQESVVDVLVTKALRAARQIGAKSVVLGGGVAANRVLRDRLAAGARGAGIPLVVPRPALCTDNGAMVGAAGARRWAAGSRPASIWNARPSLPLARR